MDLLISNLVTVLLSGGPNAIIALLSLCMVLLLLDRRRLVREITRKDERIDHVIDDYQRGNLTLAEALMSLKLVLCEIKAKW